MKKIVRTAVLAMCLMLLVGAFGACGKNKAPPYESISVSGTAAKSTFTQAETIKEDDLIGLTIKGKKSGSATETVLNISEWDYEPKKQLTLRDKSVKFFLKGFPSIYCEYPITVKPPTIPADTLSVLGYGTKDPEKDIVELQIGKYAKETLSVFIKSMSTTDSDPGQFTWTEIVQNSDGSDAGESGYISIKSDEDDFSDNWALDGRFVYAEITALKPTPADKEVYIEMYNPDIRITNPNPEAAPLNMESVYIRVIIRAEDYVPPVAEGSVAISTKQQFIDVIENTAGVPIETHAAAKYHLTADIDLEGYGFTKPYLKTPTKEDPVPPFSGVFDGRGHTVSNFTMTADIDYFAMFGNIEGGTVRDIAFKNYRLDAYTASPAFVPDDEYVPLLDPDDPLSGPDPSKFYSDEIYEQVKDEGFVIREGFSAAMLANMVTNGTVENVYIEGSLYGSKWIGSASDANSMANSWDWWCASSALVGQLGGGAKITGCITNVDVSEEIDTGIAGTVVGEYFESMKFNPTKASGAIAKITHAADVLVKNNFFVSKTGNVPIAYQTDVSGNPVDHVLQWMTVIGEVEYNEAGFSIPESGKVEYGPLTRLSSLYWSFDEETGMPVLVDID
jgi:hypothetical protein